MNRNILGTAALLFFLASGATAEERPPAGTLVCPAPPGSGEPTWTVEFDAHRPFASVNGEQYRADYSVSHIRIELEAGAKTLTIGRVTGRALLSTPTAAVALGRCRIRNDG